MNETDKGYWLLSETSGIGETRDPRLQRNLPLMAGLGWLAAGWRDFWTHPSSSIAYGLGMFVLSVAFVWTREAGMSSLGQLPRQPYAAGLGVSAHGAVVVGESGIHTHAELLDLARYNMKCFLVGESLMKQPDVSRATAALLGAA